MSHESSEVRGIPPGTPGPGLRKFLMREGNSESVAAYKVEESVYARVIAIDETTRMATSRKMRMA